MKILRFTFSFLFLLFLSYSCSSQKEAPDEKLLDQSPVDKHGQLSIKDGMLVDVSGEMVQLKGMSLFWSQWQPQFFNHQTVENLVGGWDIQLIRAAMAVEHDGYLENPEREMDKVKKVIEAAIDQGIYVIVDWHDHHAEDHLIEAKDFFSKIAKEYGDYPHLIYEPYNEPLDVSWTGVLKPYHEEVIASIRQYDPDNIIVLGTPNWSQRVDLAAEDPVRGENLAYTLHFYAGTHGQELRGITKNAMDKGLPIFVTEFGTTDANGDGLVYAKETRDWMEFMDRHNLSWANWSVADKDESSAAVLPCTTPSEINNEEKISTSGKLVRSYLKYSK
ncbi:glycoside hydrolase family 5 protein [Salinimicrobium sp. TH3]|uniref:glycoside hydrolase family 5 protein n=1 Tax=Salinimicrobium sp. TH3 TaxID=2997342 RepID=UPI002274DF43|nr:glycoside hydrolase family 5 protein [Salinimicrobium sp. TH3]MCY2685537.1 glycoside hydrolase family 5 protein [Salinimicrobium sp. TH3]